MANGSQLRSLGKFLYTQNPFYLISCFLILYGLQMATLAEGRLFSRSVFFSLCIAGYMLLMAVTCVGVVRLGKIWEDGRSIFLVVIISQVALSASLDELSIMSWSTATGLLLAGAGLTVAVSEFVLRACRLRFPSWYRCSFYALLLIFFAMPMVLGHAVGGRNTTLTNWGSPIFSSLIAAALLLLIPAVRQGAALVQNNGTPWSWPLYPLSAFVILIVLAAIRTHAIWMSFGFIGAPVRFEPFLLLPIALAILVLLVESDAHSASPQRAYLAMGIAPLLLLCGTSRGGMTFLPIQADLQRYFGSAQTIVIFALIAFYGYTLIRGLQGSEFAVTASLMSLCAFSELPEVAQEVGLQYWMYGLIASLFALVGCLRVRNLDYKWLTFAVVVVLTILMAGHAHNQVMFAQICAGIFGLAAMLTIGASFHTELATFLRHVAALLLAAGSIAIIGWHIFESTGNLSIGLLIGLAVLSLLYMQIVKRWGWLYVGGVQLTCLLCVLAWNGYQAGAASQVNWSIQSGLLCFVIGLTITSVKTGVHRRFWRGMPEPGRTGLQGYQSGF